MFASPRREGFVWIWGDGIRGQKVFAEIPYQVFDQPRQVLTSEVPIRSHSSVRERKGSILTKHLEVIGIEADGLVHML